MGGSRGRAEAPRVPPQARSEEDRGAVRVEPQARQEAPVRRAAPRCAAAPLRPPARARRRARELGGSEGHPARAGPAAPRRPRRGPPAQLRDLRGRDPEGGVRRRHGRDLGHGHLRGPRGEAQRRSHGAARGTEARRDLGSRPGEARRRREELAAHPQARGRSCAGGLAEQVRADARDPRGDEPDAARRWLGVRDQVGRVPHRRAGRGRRGPASHPQGPGLHAALRQGREGARQGAQDPRLRDRRRGVRARRERAS